MAKQINRRELFKATAAVGLGYWVGGRGAWANDPAVVAARSPNERLNVGFIGTANRAAQDLGDTKATGLVNVAALCDIDEKFLGTAGEENAKAQRYTDFRKMLEQKDLDAIVIATPDHTHAVATAAALRLGKHVYTEKPLTHTVKEARVLTELAAAQKRVTQMGTQIHAEQTYRRVVELVRANAIGPIAEVHVWCGKNWGATKVPVESEPVPSHIHHDLWVGPAPMRPYTSKYYPNEWRRYVPYGDGTLGDMACHYMDLPFWALELGHATKVSAEGPPVVADCWPEAMAVHYEFPARGAMPAVKLSWYDGDKRPADFEKWPESARQGAGVMFIGTKGQLYANYSQLKLYPEETFKDYTRPPKSIPKSIGHHKEWALACLNNDPAATTCNFGYSGVMTEAVLLGNIAYLAGKSLDWDAKAMKFTNAPEADALLHYEYRKGWEL